MKNTLLRLLAFGTIAGSAIVALPASAAPLLFSYSPTTDPNGAFSFNIDSNPIGFVVNKGLFFGTYITNGTGLYADATEVDFLTSLIGGGLAPYSGPQLYTGGEIAPTISTGTFNLLYLSDPTQAGVLTISAVTSTVPKPAAWAMMIVGFGLLGGALRRSRIKMALSYS